MILPQGEFAAFLKASVDERSALLERMTGTELYSDLSVAAFERGKQATEARIIAEPARRSRAPGCRVAGGAAGATGGKHQQLAQLNW